MLRGRPEKQTTFRSTRGTEKQLDGYCEIGEACSSAEMLRQTTQSTWEVVTDQSLLSIGVHAQRRVAPQIGEPTQTLTRFMIQADCNQDLAEPTSVLEERYMELERRLCMKLAAAATLHEGMKDGDTREAIHISVSEAAAAKKYDEETAAISPNESQVRDTTKTSEREDIATSGVRDEPRTQEAA